MLAADSVAEAESAARWARRMAAESGLGFAFLASDIIVVTVRGVIVLVAPEGRAFPTRF